jgi:phosphoserine phosphatase
LAVFDLDGTLTAVRSPFLYVSEALGFGKSAREIAARYWRGEITYQAWGCETVALWAGTLVSDLRCIVSRIPYRPGAVEFVQHLKRQGVAVALVSVAFEQHVGSRGDELGVDHVVCNQLHEKDGRVTGKFTYQVGCISKRELVRDLQLKYGVTLAQTLVAGDTTGDIPMFGEAAVSIAVAPESPEVQQAASIRLPEDDWNEARCLIARLRPDWFPDSCAEQ